MDVNAFNAIKTYNTAQKALSSTRSGQARPEDSGGASFKPADAVKDVTSAVVKSENTAQAFMTGQADPHSVVEAMASAELAVETAVTLRNRVVEAYQELLRMPV